MSINNSTRMSLSGTTTTASITQPRRLYISNMQRMTGDKSYSFTVHFQNVIQDCKGIRLLNAMVSLNAYNFSKRDNLVTFTALNTFHSIAMPQQQYLTPQSVADAINNMFVYDVPSSLFSITWDAAALRYSLKCTNANPAFYSEFTNGPNSIWKRLGFDESQLGVAMNNNTVVAMNAPKLIRTSCLYISSPTISTNEGVANSNVNSIYQRKNILAIIPVTNGTYGSYQHFNDPIDVFRAVMLPPSMQSIQFEIFDDELYLFDDLDGNATVTLELDLEY